LKVVSESRVTWATTVPILIFLGLSFHDLGPMYATDRQTSGVRRQTDVRRPSSLNAPYTRGGSIISPLHPSLCLRYRLKWSYYLHWQVLWLLV